MADKHPQAQVPHWLQRLETPAWVTRPDGLLAWINDAAADMLGRPAGLCRGLPCHQVIAATDPQGHPVCGAQCRVRRQAAAGHPLPSLRMCILDERGLEHWMRVLVLDLIQDGGGLVHCALDSSRSRRMEEYLEGVLPRQATVHGLPALTPRETEVLRRLEEGQPLRIIARRLDVSYVTVRNHVQHILGKLQVHSIRQAVALDLLQRRE